MSKFTNTDSTIDSCDIIERIEELENELLNEDGEIDQDNNDSDYIEKVYELGELQTLAEECEQYSPDWLYGAQLIHRDYFEGYMDDMIADCYELPIDMPYWMSIKLDYDALEQDYTSVDFDGQEYLIR